MAIKSIVELIYMFDVFMNCNQILKDLKTIFTEKLIETLTINQQQDQQESTVELLPFIYNLAELIKTKPMKPEIGSRRTSYTEYCLKMLAEQLQKHSAMESSTTIADQLAPTVRIPTETLDTEPMIMFGVELSDLFRLAFEETNISLMKKSDKTNLKSSISKQHLKAWTRSDFMIKLSNDDVVYHVHKLILCGRWKYFCLMIESGLQEANQNEMTLSEDWNRSRFEKLMKYIYLNEFEFDELDDVSWLMNNGKLYGIIAETSPEEDNHNSPVDINCNFNEYHNTKNEQNTSEAEESIKNENEGIGGYGSACYGFEELYDHCIGFLCDQQHCDH